MVRFSPQGRRLTSVHYNHPGRWGSCVVRVWDLQEESRSPAELDARIRCQLGYKLEGNDILPALPQAAACSRARTQGD